ncbi:MAG: LuxR C-terminal-related transcriptional regulator [Actinomycetota bacterium]
MIIHGSDALRSGKEALAGGDWDQARASFEDVLKDGDDPDALDGLARALWWQNDLWGSLGARERRYAALKEKGDSTGAARTAAHLSIEYWSAFGNEAAANGWLGRAEDLIPEGEPGTEQGWAELARGERAADPETQERYALAALETARQFDDRDLEIYSLSQAGFAKVALGRIDEGMEMLDKAMAAATGGEAGDLRTVGDIACRLTEACELAADTTRVEQWIEVVGAFMERHSHLPLMSFCGVCDADLAGARGRTAEAEQMLLQTLEELEKSGQRARCIQPAARLASLRILQGRFEEAEQFVSGYEDLPESVVPQALLSMAKGEWSVAAARLHRRLNSLGRDNLLAVPLLGLLVQVQLAQEDIEGARASAAEIVSTAERSGSRRARADAELATGRVRTASGEEEAAIEHLDSALEGFLGMKLRIDAARTRLELARAHVKSDPKTAVDEARLALEQFDRAGAVHEADRAASLLRELGAGGRTGPKTRQPLTKREKEVLALLAEGLTNAEIAARLFVSTKTAGHHVSNVLAKLGLRNRAEAAAYAHRHPAGEPA